MDKYIKEKAEYLRDVKMNPKALERFLDEIYNDGFSDGRQSYEDEQERENKRQGRVEI